VLTGIVASDVERKVTAAGVSVSQFQLAVKRGYKGGDGKVETDFFPVVCFRQTAEYAGEYVGKGALVTVCGSFQNREWDSQNGKRKVTECIADGLTLLKSSEKRGDGNVAQAPATAQVPATSQQSHDPNPFADW